MYRPRLGTLPTAVIVLEADEPAAEEDAASGDELPPPPLLARLPLGIGTAEPGATNEGVGGEPSDASTNDGTDGDPARNHQIEALTRGWVRKRALTVDGGAADRDLDLPRHRYRARRWSRG